MTRRAPERRTTTDARGRFAFHGCVEEEHALTVFGAGPPALFGRMGIYKAMCDLLWTLWGLIQHANDNPAEDFWAYSVGRFERCKTLMAAAEFGQHLRAVDAG